MIYHQLDSNIDVDLLEGLHAQRAGDLIQWHREDYTLEFRTQYVELASVPEGEAEKNRASILKDADSKWIGESTVDGVTTFYGLDELESLEREPFAEEVTALVETFVEALVTMPEELQTPEHRALVGDFTVALADFLDAYRALGPDDVARYIAKIGITEEKARKDLELILEVY